jgi:hypothetical protein
MLPGLDLDEHEAGPVARDDVDFAEASAVAAGKNCVPFALQGANGERFPMFPKGDVRGGGHGRVEVQRAYRRR